MSSEFDVLLLLLPQSGDSWEVMRSILLIGSVLFVCGKFWDKINGSISGFMYGFFLIILAVLLMNFLLCLVRDVSLRYGITNAYVAFAIFLMVTFGPKIIRNYFSKSS